MTVTEAVAKAKELFGIEPSAAYKGIETADDFVFAVQTDTTNQAAEGNSGAQENAGRRPHGPFPEGTGSAPRIAEGIGQNLSLPAQKAGGKLGLGQVVILQDMGPVLPHGLQQGGAEHGVKFSVAHTRTPRHAVFR